MGLALGLVPHESLQLSELVPQIGVGRWDGLSDGGIDVGHARLWSRAQVSSAWIVSL